MKFQNPQKNSYEIVLIMAEYRRQFPDDWRRYCLKMKTHEEVVKWCIKNEIWEILEDSDVFSRRRKLDEEKTRKPTRRGR